MKKIAKFLFAILLIVSVNGNAAEKGTIHLVSLDSSSPVVKENIIKAEAFSEMESEEGIIDVSESISLLILGIWLIVFGAFWRKTLSRGCFTCPLT
jgi:hypothetical protein